MPTRAVRSASARASASIFLASWRTSTPDGTTWVRIRFPESRIASRAWNRIGWPATGFVGVTTTGSILGPSCAIALFGGPLGRALSRAEEVRVAQATGAGWAAAVVAQSRALLADTDEKDLLHANASPI